MGVGGEESLRATDTITTTACCQSAVSNVRLLQDQPHTLLHPHHHGYQGAKKASRGHGLVAL